MSNRDIQPELVGQLRQAKLPPPRAIAVWVATIGLNLFIEKRPAEFSN